MALAQSLFAGGHAAGAVKRELTVPVQAPLSLKLAVTFTAFPSVVKPVISTVCGLLPIATLAEPVPAVKSNVPEPGSLLKVTVKRFQKQFVNAIHAQKKNIN